VNGVELPSFRGHIVHSDEADGRRARSDPERLVQGYYQSARR
jgi:3-deoxy-D-arabino-heptulosonate 7-phosphate (DAHP) synthase class II